MPDLTPTQAVKLQNALLAKIVRQHQAGQPSGLVAEQLGVSKSTVPKVLRTLRVEVRPSGLGTVPDCAATGLLAWLLEEAPRNSASQARDEGLAYLARLPHNPRRVRGVEKVLRSSRWLNLERPRNNIGCRQFGVEDRAGIPAKADDEQWLDDLKLATQEGYAVGDLVLVRRPVLGRMTVHHVGDEDVAFGDASEGQAMVDQASAASRERYLRCHAWPTEALANEHDWRIGRPEAGRRLSFADNVHARTGVTCPNLVS